VILGELGLYLIRVGNAVNDGISLRDVFDVRQETMDAGNAVYDARFRDYNAAIQKIFEDAYCSEDILLLHRLEIHPFARGQKLGLAVLIKAIEDWSSGCSLVLMKPFPLQFEVNARNSKNWESLALGDFPQKEKQAFQQLRSYYSQLGFEKIGKTEFYALCTHLKWTALDELELPEEFLVPADKFTSSD
jgi:GNAT superfamily N-acetyltransferase